MAGGESWSNQDSQSLGSPDWVGLVRGLDFIAQAMASSESFKQGSDMIKFMI